MERGSGLTRRTPLGRSAGLAPGKGLARSVPMPTGERAPLARQVPVSRPRKPRVAPEVRDAVRARSRGLCEVAVIEACRRRGRRLDTADGGNQHHRLPGRMGGSKRAGVHSAANLLDVCGHGNTTGCHGHIERHRGQALANGWLLREGQDPAAVPVTLWNGRRVLLGESYRVVLDDA